MLSILVPLKPYEINQRHVVATVMSQLPYSNWIQYGIILICTLASWKYRTYIKTVGLKVTFDLLLDQGTPVNVQV